MTDPDGRPWWQWCDPCRAGTHDCEGTDTDPCSCPCDWLFPEEDPCG